MNLVLIAFLDIIENLQVNSVENLQLEVRDSLSEWGGLRGVGLWLPKFFIAHNLQIKKIKGFNLSLDILIFFLNLKQN